METGRRSTGERLAPLTCVDRVAPPGEARRIPLDVNMSTLNGRIAAIGEPLGALPDATWIAIVAETNLKTSVADDQFADTRTDRLDLRPGGGTCSVSPSVAQTQTQTQTYEATELVEVGVPAVSTPLQQYGGPALLIIASSRVSSLRLLGRQICSR